MGPPRLVFLLGLGATVAGAVVWLATGETMLGGIMLGYGLSMMALFVAMLYYWRWLNK